MILHYLANWLHVCIAMWLAICFLFTTHHVAIALWMDDLHVYLMASSNSYNYKQANHAYKQQEHIYLYKTHDFKKWVTTTELNYSKHK